MDNRKAQIFKFLNNEKADIVCMQEVLSNQLADLNKAFSNIYSFVGVGRDDGKDKGEYVPIFYNKMKFEKLEEGIFWLSSYPDSVGMVGWDARHPRIATWIKLKNKKDGLTIGIVNTHLDNIGVESRLRSAELIKSWILTTMSNSHVILTGDLNCTEESVVYQVLKGDDRLLKDVCRSCKKFDGVRYTFHKFGRIPEEKRLMLDYILVSPVFYVKYVRIPKERSKNGVYLSDHNPIIADLVCRY
jgi:endonuclease/exonuclease/phosphatase family metal-dependent hydrolase